MKSESDDTDPEAERARIEAVRRMPMWKRAEQWNALNLARRELILAVLRDRYPQADEQELRKRPAARTLPREIVIRMFNWDPEKEGY
jgi:hypothetical protein